MDSENPRQVIYALLAGPDNTNKQELIQRILSKLHVLLKDAEIELAECIAEMGHLAQSRGKQIIELLKKEVFNMPITLSIKKQAS